MPTEEIEKITFKTLIMTIGNLPSSYVESLSYYECMLWLCNYLENTVVPAVNNNGEAVEELQSLYVELKNYVDEYFDNLDVQQEINNKLDELVQDGTLTDLIGNYVQPRINEQNAEIEAFKTLVNSEITTIQTAVNNVGSGSPLVASSTSDMTDTTRIYVNTTDGKWYYYDGDSWEIGGTYQSTGIGNGTIDILQLDDNLQSNYFMQFGDPLTLGASTNGYYKKDGTFVSDNNYRAYSYSLTNVFNGNNNSALNSLVIKDSNNNVVYASNPNNTTGYNNYLFNVKESGMTAYLSTPASFGNNRLENYIVCILRKLTNVYNQIKYSTEIPAIITLDNTFLQADILATSTHLRITSSNDYTIKIYQLTKGRRYDIIAQDIYNVCGMCIVDLNMNILETSSTENVGGTHQTTHFEYNSTKDGYIILTYLPDQTNYPTSISVINNTIAGSSATNALENKKLGIDGDSIMKGVGNNNVGYGAIIATNNHMQVSNQSVGGGTIATGTYQSESPRHWISVSVENIASDCDYVIINGGYNDYVQSVPMGTFTNSYTGTVDSTTFYGALETLCRNLLSRFPAKKIAFCTNHNINNSLFNANNEGLTMADYIEATYKVLNKYGIKIIDVGKNTHLSTAITSLKNSYTADSDGVHPNQTGYELFYVDYVTKELQNL